ncbi:adenylate/guanylate cyclase domain-containing protein [Methylobacterium oryzisoli]|uniref:adenylate/guanylate cyclase domain-containing protein n=1 Tax=Methylobacterium oryzisoli TaxID=3385502 RepID=UPI003891627B
MRATNLGVRGSNPFERAPEERIDRARTACLAACAIAREVETFNAARRSAEQHACRMRIGLHTGPVAVGNAGLSGRVDYTIIGRVVNVAQRFEHHGREVDDENKVVVLASSKTAGEAGADLCWLSYPTIEIDGAGAAFRLPWADRRIEVS